MGAGSDPLLTGTVPPTHPMHFKMDNFQADFRFAVKLNSVLLRLLMMSVSRLHGDCYSSTAETTH